MKCNILVSYDDLREIGIGRMLERILAEEFVVKVFGRIHNAMVRADQVTAMRRFGDKVEWVDVPAEDPTALGLCFAYYIGQRHISRCKEYFYVVSRDKAFDNLVEFVNGKGMMIRRLTTLRDFHPIQEADSQVELVVNRLKEMDKRSRPRVERTLIEFIAKLANMPMDSMEVGLTFETLKRRDRIVMNKKKIVYLF